MAREARLAIAAIAARLTNRVVVAGCVAGEAAGLDVAGFADARASLVGDGVTLDLPAKGDARSRRRCGVGEAGALQRERRRAIALEWALGLQTHDDRSIGFVASSRRELVTAARFEARPTGRHVGIIRARAILHPGAGRGGHGDPCVGARGRRRRTGARGGGASAPSASAVAASERKADR